MNTQLDTRQADAVALIALDVAAITTREFLTALNRAYVVGYQHAEDDYVNAAEIDDARVLGRDKAVQA